MTPKQQAFIIEYLRDFNATRAAIHAGYSPKTAYSHGQRLLKNVEIAGEIEAEYKRRAMPADEIISRMSDIARGSANDYLTIDKYGYASLDLAKLKQEGKMHLIKKYKVTKQGIEVELHDALAALVHLGKGHGLWVDKDTASWRKEIIELLQSDRITPQQVRDELGDELASELFKSASISTTSD